MYDRRAASGYPSMAAITLQHSIFKMVEERCALRLGCGQGTSELQSQDSAFVVHRDEKIFQIIIDEIVNK